LCRFNSTHDFSDTLPSDIPEQYLKKGIHVRLLMMNPDILLSHFDFEQNPIQNSRFTDPDNIFNMLLRKAHIDKYFCRERYFSEVNTSFLRLRKFILELEEDRQKGGQRGASIEMRVFNSFIPMSITAVNRSAQHTSGIPQEFVAEFLLPFSPKRFLVPYSIDQNPIVYRAFIESIEELWKNSVGIIRICSALLSTQYGIASYARNEIKWNYTKSNELTDHKLDAFTPCEGSKSVSQELRDKKKTDKLATCRLFEVGRETG
jgi:hypothetical protein